MLPGKVPAGEVPNRCLAPPSTSRWSALRQDRRGLHPEFEIDDRRKVNYDTPSFPIYNQRTDIELPTRGSAYDVLT